METKDPQGNLKESQTCPKRPPRTPKAPPRDSRRWPFELQGLLCWSQGALGVLPDVLPHHIQARLHFRKKTLLKPIEKATTSSSRGAGAASLRSRKVWEAPRETWMAPTCPFGMRGESEERPRISKERLMQAKERPTTPKDTLDGPEYGPRMFP